MVSHFLFQVILFCVFPSVLSMEKNPHTRRVSLYIYVSLVLLMGGFLGAVYSLELFNSIKLSGGTIAYGGFMMACVILAFIERDAFILQNIMRLVFTVGLFKVLLFALVVKSLRAEQVINALDVPAALFELSIPLIILGAVLIILELYLLIFLFDKFKSRIAGHANLSLAYSLSFVFVIVADGILFPLLAFGVHSDTFELIIGNFSGKVLIACSYGLFLFAFLLFSRHRMEKVVKEPLLDWNLLLSSGKEIVEQMDRHEQQLRQAKTVFETSREGIAILNLDFAIVDANNALVKMVNPLSDDTSSILHDKLLERFLPPETGNRVQQLLKSGQSWSGEINWSSAEMRRYGLLNLVPVTDRIGSISHYTLSLTEVSELVHTREELRFLANHDVLTALPNRRQLHTVLARDLRPFSAGICKALLIIDLDNFKQINDSFGHVTGDELLLDFTHRISFTILGKGTLYRIGGDEFAIWTHSISSIKEALDLAEAVREEAIKPFRVNNDELVRVNCCIGISAYPHHAKEVKSIYQQADTALYWAKELGKGSIKLYKQGMTDSRRKSLQLESALRDALANDEIQVYWQPQINLQSGEFVGAEVLARWESKTLGWVAPDVFIPIAENAGLMSQLTRIVFAKTCDALISMPSVIRERLKVAVNLSALDISQPDLLDEMLAELHKHALSPSRFELELTESALLDMDTQRLAGFKDAGFCLALDDFGTGYSSLAYLNTLPFDVLKIDKSFIAQIPHEQSSCSLTHSIIHMGRELGCEIVAEGVETVEQVVFLTKERCHKVQGYLYTKPLPIDEFVDYCESYQSPV